MAEPVRTAEDSLRPTYAATRVHLAGELTPTRARADVHRIEQVTLNLLSNALKFSPTGGTVTVTLKATRQAAVLEVADRGVGIPADELPHVFDRFWRGSGAARSSGSGIGLAVVRALVEAQGGSVEVESEPHKGSRFTVRLPR